MDQAGASVPLHPLIPHQENQELSKSEMLCQTVWYQQSYQPLSPGGVTTPQSLQRKIQLLQEAWAQVSMPTFAQPTVCHQISTQ